MVLVDEYRPVDHLTNHRHALFLNHQTGSETVLRCFHSMN